MKRFLRFEHPEDYYVIVEDGQSVFSINESDLKFDAFLFYKGLFSQIDKSTNINLANCLCETDRIGNYIYNWLLEIFQAISEAFPSEGNEEDLAQDNDNSNSLKIIPLYQFSACAGTGFSADNNVPHTEYPTNVLEADYAVSISGHSMEPTISEGTIIFVKASDTLEHNDIGIFVVNGETMCKRYIVTEQGTVLVSDNESEKYPSILLSSIDSFSLQGKVIKW